MITYRREDPVRFFELFTTEQQDADDFKRWEELTAAHWAEVATHKDVFQLAPDYDRYLSLAKSGKLLMVTARDEDRLIGYITVLIGMHLHYKTVLIASEDIHYISPEYRRRGTGRGMIGIGRGMIREMERILKENGVKFFGMRTKCHADHGRLLSALGFTAIEVVYGKPIGE